ncbi:hypothetical protein NVP1124O_24 [Vibrio phage 1.124.O._10N.286.49.B1]|nr:hypothetical protein NVP1124O_24 [Vibrio phage 1.124.O._10N.286.49.B1]
MPIEQKQCKCGCGRTFLGTSRRLFATDYCRVKFNRKKKNEKQNSDEVNH